MFEHQTPQILLLPNDRVAALISCLVCCIQNPFHDVQEAGFRGIVSVAIYIRTNSASQSIRTLLESLLAETMECLFIGNVDSESVSTACAAVHSLATVLPVYSFCY
jgi:hypothetical protein